jgi:hypothetical protein
VASETSAPDLGGLCGKPEFDASGDRDCRPTGRVVRSVGAANSTPARVPAGERVEVEPRLGAGVTDSLEATAALGARDRRGTSVAN